MEGVHAVVQAAEMMEEGPADVGNPEGIFGDNCVGLGPAVAPGQHRRRVRRVGKMPLKPGGPCFKCADTGKPASDCSRLGPMTSSRSSLGP